MAASNSQLREEITKILDGADLDSITAKKVREQLETNLKLDLSDQRKEVDKLIMDILDKKQNQSESEEEESEEETTAKKGGKRGAPKKRTSSGSEDDYAPKAKKGRGAKAAASPAKKRGGGGTGFTKVCNLSPELASIMGTSQMARHEVVKKMWSIIKEKNLYDPKNKQFAICNSELLPVIGTKRFRTFGMMKYLKHHIHD